MKINIRYIIFVVIIIIIYMVLDANMPKKFNWTITFYHKDKNPFGALVLDDMIRKSWNRPYHLSNNSLYLIDSIHDDNLIILCDEFDASKEEISRFLQWIYDGGNALIAANRYDSLLADTLDFYTNELSFAMFAEQLWQKDSMAVHFTDPSLSAKAYFFPKQFTDQHFVHYDSANATVIAADSKGHPVAIGMPFGKGLILLSSTPLAFTNYALLKNQNDGVVTGLLSYLPPGSLQRSEYYQLGLMESISPFRYVLSESSLRWAFYLLIVAILLFFLFGAKRNQRIIPVIEPLRNTTVDFIKTVSRLYFHRGDHRDLAMKKILYFTESLRHNFYINPEASIEEMARKVASKTGSDTHKVQKLFERMHHISRANRITAEELKYLSTEIDRLNERLILKYK